MINKKKHLNKEERFLIEKMLKINKSITYIAKLLDRGVSTVSEEVSRYGGKGNYSSATANNRAIERQLNKKQDSIKSMKSKRLRNIIDKHLLRGLSPEAISKTLRIKYRDNSNELYVSGKSIRKYINHRNKLQYKH